MPSFPSPLLSDAPILLALLLSRFFFFREGEPVTTRSIFPKTLVDLLALALLVRLGDPPPALAFALPVLLVVGNLLLWNQERTGEAPGLRVITLFSILIPFVVAEPIPLNDFAREIPARSCILAISALLALKESNFLIRWFFRRHRLAERIIHMPNTENGRLIGDLERLLLLVFLWMSVPVAAPVIVAVKGLARFKQMEDTAFAEYVIIGTFLSVLCALAAWRVALLV
jgi:hypothetical protein